MRIQAFLAVQACLLCIRPGLLPVWGDEQFTLDVRQAGFLGVLEMVARDSHPPAYYWLVQMWCGMLPGVDPLIAIRLLSALTMLCATWVLWRFFVSRLTDPVAARGVMLLWVFSPFVLMYGRMARSYSLQALLFLLGVYAVERAEKSGRFVQPALLTAVVLYVHYIPGFCLLTLVLGRLVLSKRWRPAAVYGAVTLGAYSPWIAIALSTASREMVRDVYSVLGSPLAEHPLRIAYTWAVWHFGETLPLVWMAAGVPLTGFAALLAWHSARKRCGAALSLGAAVAVSYMAVSRVVIFSLVPARLLFLTPFYWMLVATGRAAYPRAATAAASILMALNAAAISNYFMRAHFLNKGYLIPFEELSERFRDARSGVVLVDIDSIDTRPVWPRIPAQLRRAEAGREPTSVSVRSSDPVVFHVRGTRDLSWDRANDRLDRELEKTRSCTREGFVPYSTSDHWLMGVLGWQEKPAHLLQLVTCRL